MKVLVTGGSGMVGSSLKILKSEWIYLRNVDLTDFETVRRTFTNDLPEIIIHLAANVGGLFKNEAKRLEMFNSNLMINYNVLQNAYLLGIKRIICCLSTCIFPEGLNRVLTEKDLHLGEPHHSNYGYAYANVLWKSNVGYIMKLLDIITNVLYQLISMDPMIILIFMIVMLFLV